MDAYTGFAQVYDLFMDNVPYERWCAFIDEILKEDGIRENILLDLGCGTGVMTRIMASKGYDMIGVDYSAEMLDIAREQEYALMDDAWEAEDPEDVYNGAEDTIDESIIETLGEEYYSGAYEGGRTPTIYLCQDMRELELYGTIGACYCSCNSLNYILEEADLCKVFSLVNNYLFPEGLFIFDINTAYKYETLMGDNTIAENRPEGSFIWENSYDRETGINIYDLTLYISGKTLMGDDWEEESDGAVDEDEMPYYRFHETHYQKCYTIDMIKKLLAEAGMEFVAVYDNYSKEPVRADSEIVTFIARKGKNTGNL